MADLMEFINIGPEYNYKEVGGRDVEVGWVAAKA